MSSRGLIILLHFLNLLILSIEFVIWDIEFFISKWLIFYMLYLTMLILLNLLEHLKVKVKSV